MQKELPEGWVWKRLGDVGKIISGVTYKSEEASDEPQENFIPILRAMNINGELNFNDLVFVPTERVSKEQFIRVDDVVIAMSSGSKAIVGKTAQAKQDFQGSFGAFCAVFRCNEDIDKKYVGLFFQTPNYRALISHLSRGANINNLRKENFKSMLIPLPPLPVQRQIVAVLEQAEALKRQREEADALTGAFLQSVFYEMFGDPVENEKGWKIKKLGDLGDWTSGGTPSRVRSDYFEGDIPWYSTGELNDSYLVDSLEHISQEGLDSSAAKIFPIGTMLIGMYDSAAFKMGILRHPSATNQACAAFTPRTELIDTLFALQLFKAMKPSFLSRRRGVRQKNLNQQIIKDFEVPVPPLPLQQQFACVVQDVERIREQQVASGNEIEGLCEGLMQRAFAGELIA